MTELGESDFALATRSLDGDRRAFEALYRRHAPALARRLHRILYRSDEAQDVLQSTFTAAWKNLSRFRADASFEGWLNAIAYGVIGNHLKAKRRHWWQKLASRSDDDESEPLSRAPDVRDDSARPESREMLEQMYKLLDEMPVKKRVAFTLYEFEGLELKEIGSMVGASVATVWARVESARRELKEKLGLEGEADDGPPVGLSA